jgi:hypothetical protein
MVIAAGAYVLGTRDGRERFDQIVQKARSLSDGVKRGVKRRAKGRAEDGWESSRPGSGALTHPMSGSS